MEVYASELAKCQLKFMILRVYAVYGTKKQGWMLKGRQFFFGILKHVGVFMGQFSDAPILRKSKNLSGSSSDIL